MTTPVPTIGDLYQAVRVYAAAIRHNSATCDGQALWQPIKRLAAQSTLPTTYAWRRVGPDVRAAIFALPERRPDGDTHENNHFLIQTVRLPHGGTKDGEVVEARPVDLRTILQLAYNVGQYEGSVAASADVGFDAFPYAEPPQKDLADFVSADVASIRLTAILPLRQIAGLLDILE